MASAELGGLQVIKIVAIDDDPSVLRFVRRALESEGFRVAGTTDSLEGLRSAMIERPALVLLDVGVPGLSIDALLAALLLDAPERKVIVLGPSSQVSDRVRALFPEAIDFLPKPFGLADLLARVRHRTANVGAQEFVPDPNYIISGDLRLDLRKRRLTSATRNVDLSQREFALMRHLLRHRGRVCTRTELLAHVWGYAYDPGSNVVDVTIARLRTKLYDLHIETVRNVGYALREA
jgi:DNA-binding response OmpR family regulator